MKYLVKLFVVTLFTLVCTYASAEQKIVYIDMKYVLNMSKAGKGAQDFLSKSLKDSQKKIESKEKELKKNEEDLLKKKNVITKEAYAKSTDDLRKKVIEYQASRRAVGENIAQLKTKARKELLDKINPILKNYSKENNVTLIIDKKYLVMGDNDLDITNLVIEELNKVLPSLNLK